MIFVILQSPDPSNVVSVMEFPKGKTKKTGSPCDINPSEEKTHWDLDLKFSGLIGPAALY